MPDEILRIIMEYKREMESLEAFHRFLHLVLASLLSVKL